MKLGKFDGNWTIFMVIVIMDHAIFQNLRFLRNLGNSKEIQRNSKEVQRDFKEIPTNFNEIPRISPCFQKGSKHSV